MDMRKSVSGFTIVELLIVIVVIAILAAISVVAYGGIQERAKNSSRMAQGNQWVQALQIYQAQTGAMPPALASADAGMKFCLGTGFPVGGGGVPRCQNVTGTDSNSPVESANAALMSELQSIAQIPSSAPIRSSSTSLTGPWLRKNSDNEVSVSIVLDGERTVGSDCGGGFKSAWTGAGVVNCVKTVYF